MNQTLYQTKPRLELREPAFRRFEGVIANACQTHGVLKVNPKLEFAHAKTPMNCHTFALRFRDAILGYKRYGYYSKLIPKGFNLDHLKCEENVDNIHVHITNSSPQAIATPSSLHVTRDKQKVLDLIKIKLKEPPDPHYYGVEYIVSYDTDAERNWIFQQAGEQMCEDRRDAKQVSLV